MKAIVAAGVALALSGCVIGGHSGPTSMPNDAYSAIWSPKPVGEVEACLQQKGIAASYEARTAEKADGVYSTIVVVKQPSSTLSNTTKAIDCA